MGTRRDLGVTHKLYRAGVTPTATVRFAELDMGRFTNFAARSHRSFNEAICSEGATLVAGVRACITEAASFVPSEWLYTNARLRVELLLGAIERIRGVRRRMLSTEDLIPGLETLIANNVSASTLLKPYLSDAREQVNRSRHASATPVKATSRASRDMSTVVPVWAVDTTFSVPIRECGPES